jgi:hypothetical protein
MSGNVNTFECSTTLHCGRDVAFKSKQSMNMFIRLHKKTCDRCRNVEYLHSSVVAQHDWGNRNEVVRETQQAREVFRLHDSMGGNTNERRSAVAGLFGPKAV